MLLLLLFICRHSKQKFSEINKILAIDSQIIILVDCLFKFLFYFFQDGYNVSILLNHFFSIDYVNI